MAVLVALLAALATLFGPAPATAATDDPAVVRITSETGTCSAVYVADGVLLTAAHCRGAHGSVSVPGRRVVGLSTPDCWWTEPNVSCDWTVVYVLGPAPATHALVGLPPAVGAPVLVEGYPAAVVGQQTVPGFVTSVDATNFDLATGTPMTGQVVHHTAQVEVGMSGGPVLLVGRVVSLVTLCDGSECPARGAGPVLGAEVVEAIERAPRSYRIGLPDVAANRLSNSAMRSSWSNR